MNIQKNGTLIFQSPNSQIIREKMPPQRQARVGNTFKSEGWKHCTRLQPEEAIYGLGERAAALNLRHPNRTYQM